MSFEEFELLRTQYKQRIVGRKMDIYSWLKEREQAQVYMGQINLLTEDKKLKSFIYLLWYYLSQDINLLFYIKRYCTISLQNF
ncbi:hypothetical protein [Cetobacterium somerae]|uniref:hypothetical protein n=1 Tax=Cetobacterium somerae TaxID=188913 RepID=UPI003891B3E1